MTHDYKRHGTATLFAALDVLTGTVIGQCLPRHRHTEFLKFLRTIDQAVPDDLAVHLICDNYATHKHQSVRAWLDKHPRFHLHFTPTSSSWLNLVERWFRELTDKPAPRMYVRAKPGTWAIDTAPKSQSDAHSDLALASVGLVQRRQCTGTRCENGHDESRAWLPRHCRRRAVRCPTRPEMLGRRLPRQ